MLTRSACWSSEPGACSLYLSVKEGQEAVKDIPTLNQVFLFNKVGEMGWELEEAWPCNPVKQSINHTRHCLTPSLIRGMWPTLRRPWSEHHSQRPPQERSRGRLRHHRKSRGVPASSGQGRVATTISCPGGSRSGTMGCGLPTLPGSLSFASLSYCTIVHLG